MDEARELKQITTRWTGVRQHWEQGWPHRKDSRVELEKRASKILETGVLPDELDLDAIAAAERMLHGGATLISAVGEHYGAMTALRVKVRSLDWNVASGREQQLWWWMLNETSSVNVPSTVDDGWRAVRNVVCAVDDAEYREVRDHAKAMREERTPEIRRVPFDFAFPNEADWTESDMRALLASADFPKLVFLIGPLLASLTNADLAIEFLTKAGPRQVSNTLRFSCDFVLAMPSADATRVLLVQTESSLASRHFDDAELQKLACALTSIESEAMALGLATVARHPRFGRHIVSYFEHHPALAKLALTEFSRGKSLAADAMRHVLKTNARLEEPDAGSMDDAPPILRDAPWRAIVRPKLALERLPYKETVAWAPDEREKLAATPAVQQLTATIREINAAELAELDALPLHQKYVDVWPRWINKQWIILELPEERRRALWAEATLRLYQRPPCFMLALYGESALDGVFIRDPFTDWDDRLITTCGRIDSPRSALVFARVLSRRRAQRTMARTWLTEHARASAIALVVSAFGREGRPRRIAERSLRVLASIVPEVVRGVAAEYGEAARAAVESFVFADPLARLDVRGRTAHWLRLDALPALRTREQSRILPREATVRVVEILRSRGTDLPYAGIAVLRETLDPESLESLAWSLFSTWILHGRRRTHEWMPLSLAAFATEFTVPKLAPYIREWAHADPRACVTLVEVLSAIGTEPAILELVAIAEDARAPFLKEAVNEALGQRSEHIANLGLDKRGEAELDLGDRRVRVELNEALVPTIVLDGDRRVAQVPRARKGVDPKIVELAHARFHRLRRECAIVAKTGLRRLEIDMVSNRIAPFSEVELRWIRHPLLGHAARRLVWGVYEAHALVSTFRVVEDGSLADSDDLPITVDESARVAVVHPIDLDEASLTRWGTLFADYEILQPFEQLGRLVFSGTPKAAADIFKSLAGAMVEGRSLLKRFESHGWQRPAGRRVATAWRVVHIVTTTPHAIARATVGFSPGIQLDAVKSAPQQKLGVMSITGSPGVDGLHRMDLSEVVRTAITLRC